MRGSRVYEYCSLTAAGKAKGGRFLKDPIQELLFLSFISYTARFSIRISEY